MRNPVLLFALLTALAPVAALSRPAVAQTLRLNSPQLQASPQLPGPPQLEGRVAQSVLAALGEDDLAEALNALESAGEGQLDAVAGTPVLLSAAAGALHRSLISLSVDEQHEILGEWSMPSSQKSVRVLTCLVPEAAPPVEFARALGQRPTRHSFAVAKIGDMSGLFCSAWMLIVAADEVGSLRTLITKLEALAKAKSTNADFVLTLARLRDTRSADADLIASLTQRVTAEGEDSRFSALQDAVLIAAAMQRPALRPVCEQIAERLNQRAFLQETRETAAFLRRLRATVILRGRSPETDPVIVLNETPEQWVAADDLAHVGASTGSDQAYWLTHEDHIQRLSGPGNDVLLFRYPLTGTFELKAEVAVFDHGTAGLTYGGLGFDADSEWFSVREVQRSRVEKRRWPFVAPKELRMFNRVNLRSNTEAVTFLSNLHPGWSGPADRSAKCPWLGLQASGVGRVYFRNLEIAGEPIIPREVRIADSGDLRGWMAPYGENLPKLVLPFQDAERNASVGENDLVKTPAAQQADWFVADGILHGQVIETPETDTVNQSHLTYLRPLLDGDHLTYEFLYEEAKTCVHPALGRLAFLLESEGIRVHWLTDNENEWTGLGADNVIVEPLNRRGPRSLPLRNGEWNSVSMWLSEGKLRITLNGEDVYERPIDDCPNRHPGFYHDRNRTAVQIRDVVLTGNWPEKLTGEQLKNLAAVRLP